MDLDKVTEGKTLVRQVLTENFPELDLSAGSVANEVFVSLAAVGYAYLKDTIDDFEISSSINKAIANPDVADDATVDGLLSNWFTERKTATTYEGFLRVNLATMRSYFFPEGTSFFTSDSREYNIAADTTFETEDVGIVGDGTFFVNVKVVASDSGANFFVAENTSFTTDIFPANINSVFSVADFAGGKDAESNEDFLARTKSSIGTRDFLSRRSIVPLVQERNEDVSEVYVVGHDDPEMQRNVNSIGIKSDGASDVYVKQASTFIQQETQTTDNDGALYITGAALLRVNSYYAGNNEQNLREADSIEVESTDAFVAPEFARYSLLERIKLNTIYPNASVTYTYEYLPVVSDIDAFSKEDDVKSLGTSILVKSFMACYISFSVKYRTSDGNTIDEDSVKQQVADYILSWQGGEFYISKLCQFIHNIAGDTLESLSFDNNEVVGTYHIPDGTTIEVKSFDTISIDPNYGLGYSNNTFRFFASTKDITLELVE